MKLSSFTTAIAAAVALSATSASASPLAPRRFGEEQKVGLGAKISAASQGCTGNGDAALGFGGQEISTLLGAADPCGKLTLADAVVAKAKADCPPDAAKKLIEAAMDLVHAEKNFNPFAGNEDSICLNPALPASPELRGIIQLVDPRTAPPNNNDAALAAAAAELNQKAAASLAAAKAAGTGPEFAGSMADLIVANGFTAVKGANAGGTPGGNAGGNPPPPPPPPAAPPADGGNNGVDTITRTVIATVTRCPADATGGNDAPTAPAPTAAPAPPVNAAQCNYQEMEVSEQGSERRFGKGGQQVALNPAIVAQQICDQGRGDNNADCQAKCTEATAAIVASGVRGGGDLKVMGKAADDFNRALGKNTNFEGQF
ncbi:hypothetical protein HDU85_005035 [Gaertneriomyces sp. JEL0708]|nr:hypothetical protein HDU85_005035 [Gaertneriomyces sp. JEL0708]